MIAPPSRQPIVRVDRRDDKGDGLHPLLQTPKIFAEDDEQKLSPNTMRSPNLLGTAYSRTPWAGDKPREPGADSSLSPIADPHWDAHDSSRRSKDGKDSSKGERNDSRARRTFGTQDDSDSKFDPSRSQSVRDLFTVHVKPTPLQVERQAAFQQLLNPNAASGARTPSSLQPVVSATDVKPGGLGIPTVSGNSGLTPRNSDPMAALNRRHERLRGPVLVDINKKSPPPPVPVGVSLDPRRPLPLNRQPATHEFPTRKF